MMAMMVAVDGVVEEEEKQSDSHLKIVSKYEHIIGGNLYGDPLSGSLEIKQAMFKIGDPSNR